GLLDRPAFGDRNLLGPNLFTSGRNADGVIPRFRLHDTSANRVVFRPLLGHGFRNLDRVGLLDLLAFRDRNLLGPSFFTSGRDADGIVPRLRLHDASANGIVFGLLLGHAVGNAHGVGLLDLTALRDRYLPSSDFFASGRNADGVVPRLRLHHADENGVVLGLLLGHGFRNADRIGLLDLLALRDRHLSSSDFFASRRNAD